MTATGNLESHLTILASKAQITAPLAGLAAVLLLLISPFLLGWPEEQVWRGSVAVLVGSGGTIGFAVLLLRALLRAFFSRPAVLVDRTGLHGAFRLLGVRSLFWDEIKEFNAGNGNLGIHLSDSRSVLGRSGPIASMSITLRQSRGEPQIEISQKAIDKDTGALACKLNERLHAWRDQTRNDEEPV